MTARLWPRGSRGAALAPPFFFVTDPTAPRLTRVARAGTLPGPTAPRPVALTPPAAPAPQPESPVRGEGRRRRLRQEFAVRITVTSLLLLFNEAVAADHVMSSIIRLTALIGLVLNVPYYLAIRTGVALRAQAYARMLIDVALMTAGLYGAGGLAAAQYLGVYAVVPVYTAFVFSSRACVMATLFATAGYLGVVVLQAAHALPFTQQPPPGAWLVLAFN